VKHNAMMSTGNFIAIRTEAMDMIFTFNNNGCADA